MLSALRTAIFSRLGTATLAGTSIFFLKAPDNQAVPFIVFDTVSDFDENTSPTRNKNTLVYIRGRAATAAQAETMDGQIDALFHNKPLTVTGYTNYQLQRENAYAITDVNQAGVTEYIAGAEYRLLNQLN